MEAVSGRATDLEEMCIYQVSKQILCIGLKKQA